MLASRVCPRRLCLRVGVTLVLAALWLPHQVSGQYTDYCLLNYQGSSCCTLLADESASGPFMMLNYYGDSKRSIEERPTQCILPDRNTTNDELIYWTQSDMDRFHQAVIDRGCWGSAIAKSNQHIQVLHMWDQREFVLRMRRLGCEINRRIDGGWTEWSGWSPCWASTQHDTRSCTAPQPYHGGTNCTGETHRQQWCDQTAADAVALQAQLANCETAWQDRYLFSSPLAIGLVIGLSCAAFLLVLVVTYVVCSHRWRSNLATVTSSQKPPLNNNLVLQPAAIQLAEVSHVQVVCNDEPVAAFAPI